MIDKNLTFSLSYFMCNRNSHFHLQIHKYKLKRLFFSGKYKRVTKGKTKIFIEASGCEKHAFIISSIFIKEIFLKLYMCTLHHSVICKKRQTLGTTRKYGRFM